MPDWLDDPGDAMVLSVVFCRVLLAMLCGEIAWRYFLWWRLTRNEPDTDILTLLTLGIARAGAAFFGFAVYGLVAGRVPRGTIPLSVYFVLDALITWAMFEHLVPVWQLSRRWRGRVLPCIAIRLQVAAIVAFVLLALDLQ